MKKVLVLLCIFASSAQGMEKEVKVSLLKNEKFEGCIVKIDNQIFNLVHDKKNNQYLFGELRQPKTKEDEEESRQIFLNLKIYDKLFSKL